MQATEKSRQQAQKIGESIITGAMKSKMEIAEEPTRLKGKVDTYYGTWDPVHTVDTYGGEW